jgi:hypothetical protein
MKKIGKIFMVILPLISCIILEGNNLSGSVPSLIQTDSKHPDKIVYLHTDRSYFLPGESIQFKAYFLEDPRNKSNPVSDTLYLSILDQEGIEVASGMFPSDNSQFNGQIELPDFLTEGNYILVASRYKSNYLSPEAVYSTIIEIRKSADPELNTYIILSDSLYESGSPLTVQIRFTGKDKKPVQASFTYQLEGSTGEILNGKNKADAEGISVLKLQLPKFDDKETIKLIVIPSYKATNTVTGVVIPTHFNHTRINKSSERNISSNQQGHLNIQLKTVKLQNERVSLDINVTDDHGKPVMTSLSVSASNIIPNQLSYERENLVSYAYRITYPPEYHPDTDIKKYYTQQLLEITRYPGNQFVVQEKNNLKKLHKKTESNSRKKQDGYPSDRSIFEILMEIKPYRIVNDRISFGIGTMNSINNQDGALIVVDGITMGTDASILNTIPVQDIARITASTNIMDIQRYSAMNNVGLIEIFMKKNSNLTGKETNPGKADNNTLFWGPNTITDNSGNASINFINNNLSNEILISVDGIAANRLTGSSSLHYTGK